MVSTACNSFSLEKFASTSVAASGSGNNEHNNETQIMLTTSIEVTRFNLLSDSSIGESHSKL